MYKNNIDIFLEENENFERDLELSQKRYKLINEWDSDLPDLDSLGSIDIDLNKKHKATQNRSVRMREIGLQTSRKQTKDLF